ncbi:CoA-disulfide reductase [Macrococcus equipercicus]|uniref:CoA-disulfide reductase n=1 Tax=Macrococcus equipercicus TaxID=69967 RepID=A0A9Q9BUM7_9STAP|nr:CoA-disulfide reductase [Macrococcus equipercicus]UTH14436.1 CoA-disulfide reductase [Macrococcus equipercicus]
MKIIVVGAVAGGATSASQIRRTLPDADIVIYEKDRDMSFANCGLPYYLGKVFAERERLLQATPESFQQHKQITVNTDHEVTAIDTAGQFITVVNHTTGESFLGHYDALILSPGCRPLRMTATKHSDFVFPLRNLEDTDAIDQYIDTNDVQKALIIGAGYIGIEIVENFKCRGLDVTLTNRSEHIMTAMDQQFIPLLKNIITEQQVGLLLDDEVVALEGHDVIFKSGHRESFDIVIEAIGITPNTEFIAHSGIELNDKGYIKVNEYFETTADNVYALGDAIETFYRHTGTTTTVALAWGAHRGANLIAGNLSGHKERFKGLLATNIVRFFDHTIASVGISESELAAYDYEHISYEQKNHASYLPDARVTCISIYYRKDNRQLLRACIVGQEGVDKRIDIIAAAMGFGATVDDFKDIEIAYAPPYSSPKDIVNMIGYRA